MTALDEIRSYFEKLRRSIEEGTWPERRASSMPSDLEKAIRADLETSRRTQVELLTQFEGDIVFLYEACSDEPKAIDIIDSVVAVIRRGGSLGEINRVLQEQGKPWLGPLKQ